MKIRALLLTAALVAMASTAVAQPSDADREQAAKLAREAQKHGSKNELGKALEKFRQASKLDPSTPTYLCNVGMAYYGLADFARAQLNLARCYAGLGKWPDGVAEVYAFVEKELVRRKFGKVRIAGEPADATVSIMAYEDEGRLTAPLEVYAADGNYLFVVSKPGFQQYTGEVRVVGGVAQKAEYSFHLQPVAVASSTTATTPAQAVASPGRPAPAPNPRRKLYGWIGVGSGAAAAVGGVVAFSMAKSRLDDIDELDRESKDEPSYEDDRQALIDSMRKREISAYVLGGVGAALIGGGLYLLLSDGAPAESSAPVVSADLAPGGGMVSLSWSR